MPGGGTSAWSDQGSREAGVDLQAALTPSLVANATYNPEGLIKVMEILKEASGGKAQPEFMSTHPDPGNRIEHIKQVIEDVKSGKLEGPKAAEKLR